MKKIMPILDFSQSNVLVVGDLMLDSYWHGCTNRISPEAPVPIVNVGQKEDRAGGSANVAMNIAALGGHVGLMGLTGNDEQARTLELILNSLNVHCFFQHVEHLPTINKLRIFSRHQQLLRLDFEQNFQQIPKQNLLEQFEKQLSNYKAVVFSDYAKGTLSEIQTMIQICNTANIISLIDPKGNDFRCYQGATLLTPNLSEFEAVVGKIRNEEQLVERGMQLISDYQLQALLVTRSEHGMTLLRKNTPPLHLPTQAQEVFDVTGAGDTVIATLAAALTAGKSFDDACILANTAAGIVVSKLGTSTISTIELNEAMIDAKQAGYGVISEDLLINEIEQARKIGKKIVMTNGCFDILHAGHVAYLEEAARLGDYLIVAVNDDQSVKQLKGEGRPVNQVERRMAVLSGLSAVSWVIPFSEETPERLIKLLNPDILVKGGDYTIEGVVGGDWVIAHGGSVKILQFKENCSTTDIINRIQDKS